MLREFAFALATSTIGQVLVNCNACGSRLRIACARSPNLVWMRDFLHVACPSPKILGNLGPWLLASVDLVKPYYLSMLDARVLRCQKMKHVPVGIV